MNELIKFYTRGPMKGLAGKTVEIQLTEANTQQTMDFLEHFFQALLRKRRITPRNLASVLFDAVSLGVQTVFQGARVQPCLKQGFESSYSLIQDWRYTEDDLSAARQREVLAVAIRTNSYIAFLYGDNVLPYYGRPTKLRENGFQLRHSGGYRNYRFDKVRLLRGPVKPRANKLSDLHLNGVLSSPVIKLRFDDEGSGSALVRLAYADKLPPEHVREWSYERMRQKLHWIAVTSPIYESYVAESRSLWET